MRVLLVATNLEPFPYAVAPLGVLCVAAAARAAGHQVDFLDLRMARSANGALQKALGAGDYQAVAFGIRNLDNCWAFAPRSYLEEVRGFRRDGAALLQRTVDSGRQRLFRLAARLDCGGCRPIAAWLAKASGRSRRCCRGWKPGAPWMGLTASFSRPGTATLPTLPPAKPSRNWAYCQRRPTSCAVMRSI